MNILPTDSVFNIAILGLLILFLLGFALLLIAIHAFLSKWLKLLHTEKIAGVDSLKQDAYEKSAELVDSARQESLKLIEEANSRAKGILAAAGDLSQESKSHIEDTLHDLAARQEDLLKRTSAQLLGSYTHALEEQQDIGLHTIVDATKKIERGVLDEVSQFEDIVHKETVESEKLVEDKLNKEYYKVKGEMEEYKAEQMSKIDESVFNVLKEVSTQVLGSALSMEEHRDLVLRALEDAKKKNLFENKI